MVESLRPGTFAVDLTKEEVEQRSKADEYFGWAISRPTARLSLAVYYPRGVEPTGCRNEVRYASAAPGIPSSALQITEQGRVRKPSLDGPEDGAYGLKWDVDFPAVGLIYILVWAPLSSA